MINTRDILETINMIDNENLDVRTVTMGISLLDCCDSDIDEVCRKVYEKITRCAKDLVKTGEAIEKEMGIPIINKRGWQNAEYAFCLREVHDRKPTSFSVNTKHARGGSCR